MMDEQSRREQRLHAPTAQAILDHPHYLLREREVPLSGEGLLFRILHHPFYGIPLHRLAMISQELYRNVRHRRKAPQTLRQYLLHLHQDNEGRLFPLQEHDTPLMQVHLLLQRLESALHQYPPFDWLRLLLEEDLLPRVEREAVKDEVDRLYAEAPGLTLEAVLPRLREALQASGEGQPDPRPGIAKPDAAFIEQLLTGFRLSVSSLNNFLKCPLQFYYESLLRAPGGTSEAAQYGSSMHDAVDRYYSLMMEGGRSYPPLSRLLAFFHEDLERNRHCFRPERLAHYLDKGTRGLQAFHTAFIEGRGEEFIRTEVRLEAKIDGVPVKGFIDRMQYRDGEVTITDFKTGSLARCDARLDFTPAGDPQREEGGNYWRQAVVYKLLYDRQKTNYRELQAIEFLFIEPNEEGNFNSRRIHIRPEDEEAVREQIRTTWSRIQAHDFFTGCGKAGCSWCELIKLREAKR